MLRILSMLGSAFIIVAFISPVRATDDCNPGARCFPSSGTGAPARFVAQCSGRFPDFVSPVKMITGPGPWFKLSQAYPSSAPSDDYPWLQVDFANGVRGANAYLYALRDYAFEGMLDVDFRPELTELRAWFHMPMMNFGPYAREPLRGLTTERTVVGPELGIKPGVEIHNYAIGFYNAVGGVTIGKVWKTNLPDVSTVKFQQGTMTFKLLFTDAEESDFQARPYILAGAPQWKIATGEGLKTVTLMQMDVAAVDARSPTGWVFGTFAYDAKAPDLSPWRKLRPVGLSWGNDYGFTPADQEAGKHLKETIISDEIPAYAGAHLGWAGRTNGPVDNPISGCLSCHSTAQDPSASIFFGNACVSDKQKMFWFRDFSAGEAFGAVDFTCKPVNPTPIPNGLDFSLQLAASVQNVHQYRDVNPCSEFVPRPNADLVRQSLPGSIAKGFGNALGQVGAYEYIYNEDRNTETDSEIRGYSEHPRIGR